MKKKKTRDELVELKVGEKTYNKMVEYLLMLAAGEKIFDDKNPGIQCLASEIDRWSALPEGEKKDKTFVKFEMTLDFFSFISEVRDLGAGLASDMFKYSLRRHRANKRLKEITGKAS